MMTKRFPPKFISLFLAAVFLLQALPVSAKESDQILDQIDVLRNEQALIQSELDELQAQQNENWASIEEMVAYKNSLDAQVFLLYSEMETLDELIRQYARMIAETQTELDQAQAELDQLTRKYKDRIRTMEEEGPVSYWSVLFKANSFIDFIDRMNMIREISAADEKMMAELEEAAEKVAQTKQVLVDRKSDLEGSRKEQEATELELSGKREEADRMLQELGANQAELEALYGDVHAQKDALIAEIAQAEQAYNEAKAREEEERRRQEEEEERRRQEEEERRQQEEAAAATKPTEPAPEESTEAATEPTESTEPSEPEETQPEQQPTEPPANEGWRIPCSYTYISSSYGNRGGGFHNGVDFAAPQGTPIYATRSGTVTTATAKKDSNGNYISYGNYVVINHGDGFSSLYAHMIYYVVNQGDYVNQGQLIGYVGSTGNSSGNHLHLTFFYKGATVNPMDYLS